MFEQAPFDRYAPRHTMHIRYAGGTRPRAGVRMDVPARGVFLPADVPCWNHDSLYVWEQGEG